MLTCVNNNISITRGDSAIFALTIKKADGEPYEITEGDTVIFTVKMSTFDTKIITQKTVVDGVVRLHPEDTKDLEYGTYYYDVELTQSDGFVSTVISPHKFIVEQEVTY